MKVNYAIVHLGTIIIIPSVNGVNFNGGKQEWVPIKSLKDCNHLQLVNGTFIRPSGKYAIVSVVFGSPIDFYKTGLYPDAVPMWIGYTKSDGALIIADSLIEGYNFEPISVYELGDTTETYGKTFIPKVVE